ncbi:hypothetical protein Hdeb2414_s0006g00217731 [Helianthus debilis subsp. tardiflorus]
MKMEIRLFGCTVEIMCFSVDDDNLCVIVISVERNIMCVDIMSNFVLMMIILCVFCFLYLCMLSRLFGCTVELMCFCVDDDNFMLFGCTVEIMCFCVDDDNFMCDCVGSCGTLQKNR